MTTWVRRLAWCLLVLSVAVGVLGAGEAKPKPKAQPQKPKPPAPAKHEVKPATFKIEVKLKGIFESAEMAELAVAPKAWGQLQVVKAAEQQWMASAPVIIAVVGTTPDAKMHCQVPTDPVDCAIAIDHMTLAAVAEGLGTCWIGGQFDEETVKEELGVPDDVRVVALLPLGYPAEASDAKDRKPMDEIVSYDKW